MLNYFSNNVEFAYLYVGPNSWALMNFKVMCFMQQVEEKNKLCYFSNKLKRKLNREGAELLVHFCANLWPSCPLKNFGKRESCMYTK
jgi:hypothetical protein